MYDVSVLVVCTLTVCQLENGFPTFEISEFQI